MEREPVAAPNRIAKPSLLLSPNSILANALLRSIDILRPRVLASRPSRIEFVVGTQINGAPHLGTNLVQPAAFLLAKVAGGSSPSTPASASARWTMFPTT